MIVAPVALLIEVVGYLFLLSLIVRAVFSWIEPYPRNRIHRITFEVTEPLLAPVRRWVPPVGGFDIAYLIVFIGVSFVIQLVGRLS
ncbi:MAG TPA: YggT family protein [Candidatus Dormibacteraeota bacterium]|nr:YggT family protein [Candidatus Dormibacteraeota bacterium]